MKPLSGNMPELEDNRLFRTIVESSASAVFIFQGEQMRYVNASALSITAYSKEELLAMPFRAIIHKDFQDMVKQRGRARQRDDDVPVGYDVKIVRKDGETRWVNFRASMIELDGKPADLVSVRDITEYKQAEEKSQFNKFTMDHSPAASFCVDQDANFVHVNETACQRLGYSRDELLTMSVFDISTELPRDAWPDHWQEIKKRGSFQLQSVHKTSSGKVFPVEITVNHACVEGREYNFAFAVDITDRKQSEEAIQTLVASIVGRTGQDFFDNLVSQLAQWLNMECVILGERDEGHINKLAMVLDNKLIPHFSYALTGTPCENVVKAGFSFYGEGICQLFPNDDELLDMGAESYVGTPLQDTHGKNIGVLCAIGRNKLALPNKARDIFEIIASKTVAEIRRKKADEMTASLNKILEDSLNEIYIFDAKTLKFIQVNYGARLNLGYDLDELEKLTPLDLKPEHTQASFEKLVTPLRTGKEKKLQFTTLHRRKDGSLYSAEINLQLSTYLNRKVFIAIILDVSLRKRVEYFARKSADILEMVATSYSPNEVYDAICRMHERMYPRMRSSILKLKDECLFHCSAPSLPEQYVKAVNGIRTGPCVGSCGTAAFLGKEVIVEDIATDPLWADYKDLALPHNLLACWSKPIIGSDGTVLGTFAMYFDQPATPDETELSEIGNATRLVAIVMEKELREAMLIKLSEAVNQAGESIVITDREGIIEYVNPAFSKLTGYGEKEAIGQTPGMLKSGEQGPGFYKDMWKTITNGEVWHGKITDKRKDGHFYPTNLTISPISDVSGNITHFVGLQSDLTELETLEHQFHQAQKMDAIGTLVGGIAHDFNNMLAGITANMYLIKQQTQEIEGVPQRIASVEQVTFRAADMIRQLLTFARKDMVSMKSIPLSPFIKETLKNLRTTLPENIDMHQDICTDTFQIRGDTTQLHQILMNLLNNARDALDDTDEPCIAIRLEPFYADSAFVKNHTAMNIGAYVHLSVEDNGCGIPEHQIENLFEPFFTTKEVGKGTGLGLAMVFGAIKTHHGFVEVDSIEGKGSIFHIYLPLLEQENIAAKPVQNRETVEGHGELILLADDDQVVCDTTAEVLESMGYRVLKAVDGLDAIEVFNAHRQEIVLALLDIIMPHCGGMQLAERIREINPDIPVIFLTGYDKEHVLVDDEQIPRSKALTKPVCFDALSQHIRQLLDLY